VSVSAEERPALNWFTSLQRYTPLFLAVMHPFAAFFTKIQVIFPQHLTNHYLRTVYLQLENKLLVFHHKSRTTVAFHTQHLFPTTSFTQQQ